MCEAFPFLGLCLVESCPSRTVPMDVPVCLGSQSLSMISCLLLAIETPSPSLPSPPPLLLQPCFSTRADHRGPLLLGERLSQTCPTDRRVNPAWQPQHVGGQLHTVPLGDVVGGVGGEGGVPEESSQIHWIFEATSSMVST